MELSVEQIKGLIETRPKQKELSRAISHQNRLKFHTETELSKSELSPYYVEFKNWICYAQPEILPSDKVARFEQLLTCPLSTNQLTDSIAMAWSRVFEGQDAFFRYDFEDSKLEADWDEYRDDDFWRTEGFKAMINAIDSVWVVDLPSEQEGDLPEPKNMLIDISNVLDISTNSDGECNYVIFEFNQRLYVYDQVSIRVFGFEDKVIGELLSEFRHELDRCPARMFWTTQLNSRNYINHKSPLTNVLSELDWLLVHKTFKKWMDIGNSYPILVSLKLDDSYAEQIREDNKGRGEPSQKTLGGQFVGPGSILEVPIPQEGQPDLMSNPVKFISPDIDSLKFHVDEDTRLSDYIFKTAVGIDGEQNNDQAKNEKQVLASFENQTIILQNIANNFELIQAFADSVMIQLRYGREVDVAIDYGSKFFLKTADDLMGEIESVKENEIMTDTINTELIDAKYRNDVGGKSRAMIIRDLDPLPGRGMEETIKIKNAGGISKEDFKIKANLMGYVLRFEREQLPLDQFMQKGNYSEKIKKIKEEFKKYMGENPEEEPVHVGDGIINQNLNNGNSQEANSGQLGPGSNDQGE